eukprot:GHVL01014113.1.p1 GENE.GHVL01014113.1~~GHVL01014113.1.p1  ORF type:complete len:830 (+),score=202.48 GHVL01014113.1:1477-3966(+)
MQLKLNELTERESELINKSMNEADLTALLDKKKNLRSKLLSDVEKRQYLVSDLEKKSEISMEVNLMKRRLLEAEEELNDQICVNSENFENSLGVMPSIDVIDKTVNIKLKETEQKFSEDRRFLDSTSQKAHMSEEGIIKSLEAEMGGMETEVSQRLKSFPDNYETLIEETRGEVQRVDKELVTATTGEHVYGGLVAASKSKNRCQLCGRDFGGVEEVRAMEKRISSIISKLPEAKATFTEQLSVAQTKLEDLSKKQPEWSQVTHLKNSILPSKRQKTCTLKVEYDDLNKEMSMARNNIHQTELRLADLRRLHIEADKLQKMASQLKQSRRQVEEKERMMPPSTSTKSLECERDELNSMNIQIKELNKEIDELVTERDNYREQLMKVKTSKSETSHKYQNLKQKQTRSETVLATMHQRQSDLVSFNSSTQELKAVTCQLDTQIRENRETAIADYQSTTDEIRKYEDRIRDMKRYVEDFGEMSKKIAELEHRVSNTGSILEEIKQAEKLDSVADEKMSKCRQEYSKNRQKYEDKRKMRDNLKENLAYRNVEEELARSNEEINSILKTVGGLDIEQLKQRVSDKRAANSKFQQEIAYKSGSVESKEDQIRKINCELKNNMYKNVEAHFTECLVDYETTLMAQKDVSSYYTALDKALMKYHADKMAEINKSIRDLWQTVYRGGDIDYLAIRSDADTEDTGGLAVRSYNYRVVMVKGDCDLEMRGRSSAGQKVLASLIIRLALAESFCLNCGILALDEPTTNLDRHNIDSLARALADLIDQRRFQENFQLLLITHDEAFVSRLARHHICDHFFQIGKDEAGLSLIKKRDIRMLL